MGFRIERLRDERGFTLVELLVTMSILSVVLASAYAVVASVQTGFENQSNRDTNVTQINLAMQELNREILSAQAFSVAHWNGSQFSLVATGSSDNALIVYTQANATSREGSSPGPTAGFSCDEWRVVNNQLQVRRWAPNWRDNPGTLVQPWRTLAQATQVSASFLMPGSADYGGRLLQATVNINQAPVGSQATHATSETTEFTGRNVQFAPPISVCSADMNGLP